MGKFDVLQTDRVTMSAPSERSCSAMAASSGYPGGRDDGDAGDWSCSPTCVGSCVPDDVVDSRALGPRSSSDSGWTPQIPRLFDHDSFVAASADVNSSSADCKLQ